MIQFIPIFYGMVKVINIGEAKSSAELNALQCGLTIETNKGEEMQLVVTKKNVYGVERVYPICNNAKLFASISGNKTLLPDVIELIKKLGYNLTTESEKI